MPILSLKIIDRDNLPEKIKQMKKPVSLDMHAGFKYEVTEAIKDMKSKNYKIKEKNYDLNGIRELESRLTVEGAPLPELISVKREIGSIESMKFKITNNKENEFFVEVKIKFMDNTEILTENGKLVPDYDAHEQRIYRTEY